MDSFLINFHKENNYELYLDLIDILLVNSNNIRCEILLKNQDLINVNLLQIILKEIDFLRDKIEGNRLNELIELAQQLLGLYADRPLEGISSKFTLGNVYFDMGQFYKARDLYQQSLEIFRMVGDRIGEANALALIGDTFYYQDSFYLALKYYKQAHPIFLTMDIQKSEVTVLYQMLLSHYFLGEYAQAMEIGERCLEIARYLKWCFLEAHLLYRQGIHYQLLNNKVKAAMYYKKSWSIAQEIGANELQIQNMIYLGDLYLAKDLIEDAMQIYQESLKLARRLSCFLEEAYCLESLAKVFLYMGDLKRAYDSSQLSLQIKQKVGICLVQQSINFIQRDYFLQDYYDDIF
ncbi:tetratricopeptide repeat protein [Scytonema sp. UIC 10036]|uniref:tetratricopeptide repeat protein n=1 Tax=Scytonema sp. UIC 10036 TaxID=2304196 RepID=UPI00140F8C02|nr:tetratricopeptide repeat protein [Scytonema sp. UIC 10036]